VLGFLRGQREPDLGRELRLYLFLVPCFEHRLAQELLENVLSKPVHYGAWLACLDGDNFVTVEGVVAGS
jgi:hypothetical protein